MVTDLAKSRACCNQITGMDSVERKANDSVMMFSVREVIEVRAPSSALVAGPPCALCVLR